MQHQAKAKQAIKCYQLYLNTHPDAKDADKVRNMIVNSRGGAFALFANAPPG